MDYKLPRRKPTRYKDYDYNLPGYYFVTVCAQDMDLIFGNVRNGEMILNKWGEIVKRCWEEIPQHFESAELDHYTIMPNHLHGMVIINPNDKTNTAKVGNAKFAFPTEEDRTKMLLSKMIQQFKRQVTIEIKTSFKVDEIIWQKSFYDRVIRNEKELYQIRKYIKQNPLKWELEKNSTENLDL